MGPASGHFLPSFELPRWMRLQIYGSPDNQAVMARLNASQSLLASIIPQIHQATGPKSSK